MTATKTFNCDVCGEDKPMDEKHHGFPYGLESMWCNACGKSELVKTTKPNALPIGLRMFWCPEGRHFVSTIFRNGLTFVCPDCNAQYVYDKWSA